MSQFGEVSCLEMVPGDVLTIAVVFFDVRAAQSALNTLGPECCWPAPQRSSRSVRMPGSMNLDLTDVAGVLGVSSDPIEPDTFAVEFFDERDANRFNDSLVKTMNSIDSSGHSSPTTIATTSTNTAHSVDFRPKPVPVYVVPTDLVAKSSIAAQDSSTDTSVLVTGLPNPLLSNPCIEAMLQQAGLGETISNYEVNKGDPCGELLLHFSNNVLATHCVRHFEGCQWDTSGTTVTAKIVSNVKVDAARDCKFIATPPGLTAVAVVAPPRKLGGIAIPAQCEVKTSRTNSTATESTEAGPSEPEEDDVAEDFGPSVSLKMPEARV